MGDRLFQEVGGRQEIGVEDRQEFAAALVETRLERSSFKSHAVRTVQMTDGVTLRLEGTDFGGSDLARIIGRVIQHLNVEPLARIVERADAVDQPLDHIALVINRQLDGDLRPRARGSYRRCGCCPFVIAEIEIQNPAAVQPVEGQQEDEEQIDPRENAADKRHGFRNR